MAAKRKYNKKSEYWNRFDKKQSIEETLATNPLLQNSTYTPSLEGEAYFNSTAKAAQRLDQDPIESIRFPKKIDIQI